MIDHLFRQYLRRPASPMDIHNGRLQLQAGLTPDGVAGGILGSSVYYQLHGNRPDGFIQGLFEDILEQEPTQQDMDYWMYRLQQLQNRQSLANEFLDYAHGGAFGNP